MTATRNTLENYLAGRPLSEELAALIDDQDEQRASHSPDPFPLTTTDGPLTAEDKQCIRRLVYEPGFQLLIKVINTTIQNHEDSVRLLSTTDPLKNKERIVNEWAYVACFKRVLAEIRSIVEKSTS
jgi:hypothetical protein